MPSGITLLLLGALLSPAAAVARTSPWHVLGTDQAGDQEPAYIDITGMRVRQRGNELIMRFDFRDLPAPYAPGARVGAHLSIDGGRRWCCFLRGDLGPLGQHSMSFDRRDEDPDVAIEGRYDPEANRLLLFLPLKQLDFEPGDVLGRLLSRCRYAGV